jgi:hypothetical protein
MWLDAEFIKLRYTAKGSSPASAAACDARMAAACTHSQRSNGAGRDAADVAVDGIGDGGTLAQLATLTTTMTRRSFFFIVWESVPTREPSRDLADTTPPGRFQFLTLEFVTE